MLKELKAESLRGAGGGVSEKLPKVAPRRERAANVHGSLQPQGQRTTGTATQNRSCS